MDLTEHMRRQMAFSRATFGPGSRTDGVSDHIRKELVEIAESGGTSEEWVDVVLLALDGLWRSMAEDHPWCMVPAYAAAAIERKQSINEQRDWPDWRTADPAKAIEHVRAGDDGGGVR